MTREIRLWLPLAGLVRFVYALGRVKVEGITVTATVDPLGPEATDYPGPDNCDYSVAEKWEVLGVYELLKVCMLTI
jgi:hypothetical protein